MDAATRVPDFDEVRRELDEVREEMIRAIAEARAKSEIVEIFLRANQVSIDATVRSRKKTPRVIMHFVRSRYAQIV